MKKFMIFLLMAFLYLGTCQARSESAHPNIAQQKLLSWVTPTPSQSFLTRSDAAVPASFTITPSGTVRLGVTVNAQETFTANYPLSEGDDALFTWYLNGNEYGHTPQVTVGPLEASVLPYKLWCVVASDGTVEYSDTVSIIVSQHDFNVVIEGPAAACENDAVTLVSHILSSQVVTGYQYLWYVDGAPAPGVNNTANYTFRVSELFGSSTEATNLTHDFKLEVTYNGCSKEEAFYDFVVTPQPVVTISGPQWLCTEMGDLDGETQYYPVETSYTYTAAVDGQQPDHYVWFVEYNGEESETSTFTTTNVNTVSIPYYFLYTEEENAYIQVGVIATYSNSTCNSDTAWMPAPELMNSLSENSVSVWLTYAGLTRRLSTDQMSSFNVCQGSEMILNFLDIIQRMYNHSMESDVEIPSSGNITYRLRDLMNGNVVAEYTVDAEHALADGAAAMFHMNANEIGLHVYTLTAQYENIPCEMDILKYRVNVVGAPVVNVTGNNVICAGDTARLVANAYYTNTALGEYAPSNLGFKYIWSDNPEDTLNVNTKKVTEDGRYMVVVFDTVSGCTADAEFSVTTFGGDLQVTASEYQVCPNTVVALNANLDGWNNGNIHYRWGNGDTNSTLVTEVTSNSTYQVKAYILGTSNDTLCSMTQQISVNVITENYPAIMVNASGSVCQGEQVTARITDNSQYNGLYNWYFDGIEIPGEHLDTITLAMNTVGTHVFAAKRANYQCALDTVKASSAVTVNAIPSIVLTGNNVICQNDTAVLVAVGAAAGATYAWVGPDAAVSSDVDSSIRTTIPGVYSATASVAGCVSQPALITVQQLGGDLQVYASEMEVCPGTRVTLNANLNGFGNQNIAYEWKKGTAKIDSAATTSDVPTLAEGQSSVVYTVTATATTVDGNSASACQMSANIAIHVIDTTPIPLKVTVHNDKVCEGGQVSAKVVVNNDPHNRVVNYYTWYINGIEVPGQNLDSISVNLREPGEYIFSAKPADNICFAQAVTYGDKSVNVYAIPELAIDGNNTICNGDTAKMRVANVTYPAHTNTYKWYLSNTLVASDSVANLLDAGVYTVRVEDQTSMCVATTDVTVYEFGADLQVVADKMEICDGESVVLSANLDGFNNENVAYTWSNGDQGSTTRVLPTPTNTKFWVTANAGNCSMSDTIVINVHTRPLVAEVKVNNKALDTICQGEQIILTAVQNEANYTYVWYMNGFEIPGENRGILTMNMNEAGDYNFAVLPVNQYGCAALNPTAADKMAKVHVGAAPALAITGNSVICNGDTAIMTVTPAPEAGDYDYSWNGPANNAQDNVLKTVNDGIYTVTVTDTVTGCVATAEVTVTLFGGNLQVVADRMEVCDGEQVVLNANIGGFNNENIVYAWSNGQYGSTITVNPSTTMHKYSVTANAGNCSMSDTVDITVHAIPSVVDVEIVGTTENVDTVCTGEQITVKVDPARPTYTYTWYVNGIEVPGENRSTFTMNMNEAGSYRFTALATNEYGCSATRASHGEGVATIKVNAIPVVTLSGDHYYTTGATSATIQSSVIPEGEYTYAWSNGAATESITLSAPGGYGVYTLTVTDANGCIGISEPFTVSSVVDLQAHIEGVNTACQNDIVTLTAIVDYDLEGHTYQWFVNNQPIEGATGPEYVFNANTLSNADGDLVYDFTVEVSREGCATVISPVHQLTVHPIPMAVVVADTVCKNADAVLEAIVYSIGNNAQYQYVWYQDDVENVYDTVDYINTITIPAADVEGHTYAVQVLFQDITCSSAISEFVTIPVYAVPGRIDLALDPTAICTTNQGELTITDTNNLETFGLVVYDWYMNGIHLENVNGSFYRADFDHNGVYEFWATATYANYPCAVIYSDTVTENVNMHPTVMITGDPIICEGTNVQLYAQLNDTVGSMDYTYEWRLYNYSLSTETHTEYDIFHWVTVENPNYNPNRPPHPIFNPRYILVPASEEVADPDSPEFLGGTAIVTSAYEQNGALLATDLEAQDYPYIFTVVVTTPEGCRTESEPYYVYVNEHPQVVATVDYDTVCTEGEITAIAHLADYNMDNLTFQWQVRKRHRHFPHWRDDWDPISYGTEAVLHHIPGVTSQYRVIVTQTTSGCVAESAPIPVTVIVPQAIDHIVAVNGNVNFPSDHVCEGAQLVITAYVPQLDEEGNVMFDDNGDTIFVVDNDQEYLWKLNGIDLPEVHEATFSAQAGIYDNDPVDYTYTAYIVYNIPGCEVVPVNSNTVHVRRNPIVTIDGNPNVCYRGRYQPNVILLAWVDGIVDTDAVYTWFESGHLEANTLAEEINQYQAAKAITHDNPYIFTVEVTNGDGCTTISDPFYVNVYAAPEVNITGSENTICNGGEVELHANLNNYHDPLLTFQWYKDEVNQSHVLPGYTHEVETFTPNDTTNYIVEVTHLMNAFHDEEYCVAYDTFRVNVNAIPEVFAINDLNGATSICEGRNIYMVVDSIANGVPGGEVYTWYRNGVVISDAHEAAYVDSPVAVDGEPTRYTYAVSMTQAASGCESNTFFFEHPVMVYPNPSIELTTDPIVCTASDSNVVLYANVDPSVIDSTHSLQYKWFEDNVSLGVTDTNVFYLTKPYRDYPYSFSVQTVSAYGCVSEASAVVYVNDTIVVNIASTEDTICVGGEITLSATLADWNADQLTFQWNDNGQPIDGATELHYTVVPAEGNHEYTLTVNQLTSGCVATSKVANVKVNLDPVVDSITTNIPVANAVCDGYQVNVQAHISSGVAGGEVYTWYRNGQVIEGATGSHFTEVLSALNGEPTQYVYTVSVAQTAAGCESNVYTGMTPFTVNPNPTVELTTDPIVCEEGDSNVVLIANVYPEIPTGYTLNWYENNVLIASNDTVDTLYLTKEYRDYPYSFSVSVENNFGCSASDAAEVYVNAKPVVHIFASAEHICEGGDVTLSATLADWNADELVFQWKDNGVEIDGATTLNFNYVPAVGTHVYTLYVEQLTSGCTATSDSDTLVVTTIPVVDSVIASAYQVCYGAQIGITAYTTPDSVQGAVYTWYRNGILMEGATAATIYDTPGIFDNDNQYYTYTAIVTMPHVGCTSLPANTTTAVAVYANPRVQITGDQHVCETDSVFLIANVDTNSINVGRLHYTWYESGQIRDNMGYNLPDRNIFAEYLLARTEPYRFTVDVWRDEVADGCMSHSEEYLVYVYPQPAVNITATETEICTNGEVTLTANLDDYNAENITYQWYEVRTRVVTNAVDYAPGGGYIYANDTIVYHYNIPGATSATFTTNVAATTTFGVNVFQTNSTCTANDEIEIIVRPIPEVVDITVNSMDTITVCDGAQVTVNATIRAYDAAGAVYTWYRNGIEIEGANGPSFSENVFTTDNHLTTNRYTAVVTLPASGCVSAISADAGIVYINPAPSTVNISGNNVICEGDYTTLTAYSDVEGTFYWSNNVSDTNSITVPAGSYTVTLRTAEGCEMTSENFVVEALGTDLLVSASATSICRGEHTTLYVNQDGWQGNVTYQWDAQADSSTATTVDVTPDSTTIYHVAATVNSTNGSCTVNGEVKIVVNQLPGKLTVDATANTICEGQQVTINATPADAYGYIWYQNGVEMEGENQATITVNFNEAGNYTFAAKAISAEGCISAEASDPDTVVVTPAPTSVTITGINVLCQNDSTTLTAHADVTGTFTWNDGTTGATKVVTEGVYNVTLTTAEGCSLTSENFTVESFGTDLLVSASATAICQGEHTTLYVDQDGWQGNVTYAWDAQAGSSTATTVDVTPATTTTYHVTATVTNNNGSCTAEGQVKIVVNPLPVISTVTVSDSVICQGQQVTFTATGDSNTTAYIWYHNGAEIAGENQAVLTVNFNEAGTYNYAVKAVSNELCVAATAVNAPAVVVKPAPTSVTITGANVLCQNDTTTLTAHADVAGTFTWNDGTTGATKVVGEGVYNVTLTTDEGCQMTSENFTVESFGTDLLVSASATAICQGEHTTLYVDQDGWQGNVTYAWDAQAGSSTASTVDVTPATTTTYHVTATVTNNNGSCTAEGQVKIVVNPLPVVTTVTVSDSVICQGQQVTFTATGDSNTTAYIWYHNGAEIAGENQAVLTVNFNEAGTYNYAVKAISNEQCVSAVAVNAPAVVVNPAPTTVTITGANVLCQNDTTILTAHSDVVGTFTWNDGTTGATKVVGEGVYNVTLTTAEGCHMTSENFTVESFGTDLLVSASATSICEGEHTTLYVDQDGWQGNVTYAWDAQAGSSTASTVDVTPATTTTYHVTATVTNNNGSCTAEGQVKIIVNPLPVVTAVTASDTVVCEGTQVTFTATGDTNTTAYIWYNNGQEIAGENQAVLTVNFNEAGVYNYSVKAISNEQCVSAVAVNAPVVTVNAAPESVTISGNMVICNGGTTTLYANVVPNETATYAWYKDNAPLLGAMNNQLNVTTAGSYKVVASFNGCATESDAVVVTVEQAPQMQLTATESVICENGTTVITAEATGWNSEDVIYTWSNNFQGTAYTFTPATAGNYEFVVTASQATSGCVATDTINITVNAIPATPQISIINATVCDGGQVTLTVDNAVVGATYVWTRNGVVIADAHGATLTESPATVDGDITIYNYTATAILPMSGCTSDASADAVVTVISAPVVEVSVEGNTTVCEGGSTILHANVTPTANYNFQWYKDNVEITGANTADYTVAELARETAYNFKVVVTANAGCEVTANAPAITFVADPEVVATISNDITCVGGTATLTAVVNGGVAGVNGLNGYTYQWYRNDSTNSIANTATYTTTGTEAAGNYTYWVTVTSNYGCQTTSAPVAYSVVADPTVTIAVAQGYPTTVCDGGASALTANVTGGYGEITYQWYKNGNIISGATEHVLELPALTYGSNDTYTVEVAQTGVGCANFASAALNTLVTVAPSYTVDITGFGNVCEGGTLTLTATVNNVLTGDVLSYQWYKIQNGEEYPINGANAAQYSTSDLLLGNSYDYYVVVTSNISGCSVVSNSVPANVVVAPTVTINGANTVCEGGNLTLNAFVTGGVDGAAYTYTWEWTGAATGSAVTNDPNFTPNVAANDAAQPYYFTVTISRADNTGCTAVSDAHEVNVLAVPAVTVTADNNYICENGQVTFAAHVTPVGSYNYVWTINGQQQAVNASTVTTTLANTGTISASVVVSAANASASCTATDTIAVPVQVVAAPTVTLAASQTTMCVGGVTTLTATVNADNNIPGNFSYEWIVDGGTPVAGLTNVLNQTLNAAGNHTYQVRVYQDNALGCASTWSNQATVQVAEQPVVTLSDADGLAICEGGSVTLTGVVTNYGNSVNGVTNSDVYGNLTFDWTTNGINVHHNAGITNAMNQVTETLNTVGNYTYQVVVTPTGYNCQPQVSNTTVVNVVSNPSWTEVHVMNDNGTDVCLGEMVTLTAEIQGGAFDAGYNTNGHIQWIVTDANGNVANVSGGLGGNSYDIPAVAGVYTYTPTFVDNIGNGCQMTNTGAVAVGVTVHELPTATFTSGDGASICANDGSASAALVLGFTGVAPFHYVVVDGNGNTVAEATTMANTATIYVAPSEQTTYRISFIADNFCENAALDATAMATVYVNKIEFSENFFESGCNDNGTVTIHFNMISGNPSATFTVVFDNGFTTSGNISNNSATFAVPTAAGDYNAVFTVDGCSYDIVVRVLAGDYAFGGSLPIMDQRWNDVVVVNNNPATNGGHTFVSFQWYRNGVAIPGATYSNYQEIGGLNGFYSVELIERDANGNMITYKTCERYFASSSSVKVYPVPANVRQEITIELDLTSEELEGAVLDIYSVTGALINHMTDLKPITKVEGFKAQGTYFGRILTGTNEIKTVKFVIVK